jgi:peptidoglycan/xylan/chitin deacetylase (PgdA/CDA1 family)
MNKLALAANLLRWSGGGAMLRARPQWEGLLVLNYHRIGDPAASPFERSLFSAAVDDLDRQIAFMKRSAEIISPAEIASVRRRASGRSILITFDDGYRDNYDLAFPILKRHGVPATFFISTGFIDRGEIAWWDEIAWMIRHAAVAEIPENAWLGHLPLRDDEERESAIRTALTRYKALPGDQTRAFLTFLTGATGSGRYPGDARDLWMTWEMIRELRDAGMTIGAHTDSHPLLSRLSPKEQAREILTSRDRLAAELGAPPSVFAYPVGNVGVYDLATRRVLQQAGFSYAFNFIGGHQPFATFDPYDVRRSYVGHRMSQPTFEALVTLPTVFA